MHEDVRVLVPSPSASAILPPARVAVAMMVRAMEADAHERLRLLEVSAGSQTGGAEAPPCVF